MSLQVSDRQYRESKCNELPDEKQSKERQKRLMNPDNAGPVPLPPAHNRTGERSKCEDRNQRGKYERNLKRERFRDEHELSAHCKTYDDETDKHEH